MIIFHFSKKVMDGIGINLTDEKIGELLMKVVVNNTEYRANFKKSHRGKNKKLAVDTICEIVKIDPSKTGSERFVTISDGIAKHNHREKYNKILGKRVSLGRAIKSGDFDANIISSFWKTFSEEFSE